MSGGVDSSVVAKLINSAIGKKLTCIFVNTGLLMKNEENQMSLLISSITNIKTLKTAYDNLKEVLGQNNHAVIF